MTKLTNFLRSIKSKISRYDVETDLSQSLDYLSNVIEMYEATTEVNPRGDFGDPRNEKLIKLFYDNLKGKEPKGVSLTINGSFARDMITLLTNVRVNGDTLLLRIRDFKTNTISPTAMPIDQAVILRAVPHYHYIARQAAHISNILIANGIEKISRTDTNVPKRIIELVEETMGIFTSLLNGYARSNKDFKRVIDELPHTILTSDENARIDAFTDELNIDIVPGVPNNFVGSPIYSIRSVIAHWQADRYHEAEDMRTLYLLRLNHYQALQESGKLDASQEGEIEHLQNKVNKLTAKIDKMERSIQ